MKGLKIKTNNDTVNYFSRCTLTKMKAMSTTEYYVLQLYKIYVCPYVSIIIYV